MKMIYVAHPYGGNPENKEKVELIIKKLQKDYPDFVFVSPIHTFGFLYDEVEYVKGLEMCFELLKKCDEIWFCENWRESRGCKAEHAYATMEEIPIVELPFKACNNCQRMKYIRGGMLVCNVSDEAVTETNCCGLWVEFSAQK